MPQIVPKSKAPGADFCGMDAYCYIVRSDLGCYMRSTNFNKGDELDVFKLHNSCQGGEHYLADKDNYFYIIKGDNYRRVTNMYTDENAVVHSLHPDCHGGDHYLSAFDSFYIIFQDKGIFRRVNHLDKPDGFEDLYLHEECKNGLYYWGTKNYFYFVKPKDEWGIQYYRCTNFHENLDAVTYSFSESMVPFIPGGLAITEGPAFGRWEAIKTISNGSDTSIVWDKKITKMVGYTKKKMETVEHNWKISMGATFQSGDLVSLISQFQFSLSVEYGGRSVNTKEEEWSEATETEETIHVTLQPKSQVYIWQYQLGFGKETVLFCRDIVLKNDSIPPSNVPLPPSS